ncbi:unnamed protein product, partial [Prorocentrum cordatum]
GAAPAPLELGLASLQVRRSSPRAVALPAAVEEQAALRQLVALQHAQLRDVQRQLCSLQLLVAGLAGAAAGPLGRPGLPGPGAGECCGLALGPRAPLGVLDACVQRRDVAVGVEESQLHAGGGRPAQVERRDAAVNTSARGPAPPPFWEGPAAQPPREAAALAGGPEKLLADAGPAPSECPASGRADPADARAAPKEEGWPGPALAEAAPGHAGLLLPWGPAEPEPE